MVNKQTVFDIETNKYETIYNKLFEITLNTYAKVLGFTNSDELKSKYVIIEKRHNNLLDAPDVMLKSKTLPVVFITEYISDDGTRFMFKDFWPSYDNIITEYDVINIDKANDFGKDKLIDVDYVRGKGRIYNSYTEIQYELPLNNLPKKLK